MTRQELSEKYDIAETTIERDFSRVQEKLNKDNLKILRTKLSTGFDYQVVPLYDNALDEEGYLDYNMLVNENNLICNILFTLSSFESKGYGGNFNKFLEEYLCIPASAYNKKKVKEALDRLQSNDMILYKTKKTSIVVGLSDEIQQDLAFKVSFLYDCRAMAREYNISSSIVLFKVLVALILLTNIYGGDSKITYKEMSDLIGVSPRIIGETFRKLCKNDVVYLGKLEYEIDKENNFIKCLGRKIFTNSVVIGDQPIRMLKKLVWRGNETKKGEERKIVIRRERDA